MRPRAWLMLLLTLAAGAPLLADEPLHLTLGDPDRRDREAPLVLDAVTDTHDGTLLTPAELPARLADVRLLFVGESHTAIEFHRVQQRVIEELYRAGRHVMIGLEMYPYTEQSYLDRWIAGYYTEDGFVELSNWYEAWSYQWGYYRDIFVAARDHGIPMFAVNSPREVVSAVRKKGFAGLTEEEAAHIPADIDTDSAEYMTLFKSYFDEDDPIHTQMDETMWKSMLDAQCTWDATMGFNSVRALREHGDEKSIMVVLIGSGHVAYGLGIERQAKKWFDGKMATVVPVVVRDEDDEPVEKVQASYADFVWGVAPEENSLYPTLGLSTSEGDDGVHRKVIYVSEDSVAEVAGFAIGDVLVAMDGVDLDSRSRLSRLVAGKSWGDDAVFTVRRGEETLTIRAFFRRTLDEDDEDDDATGDAEAGEGGGR